MLTKASILTAAKIGAAGVSAIWLFVAARELDVAAFGDLVLLLAMGAIAVQAADLGLTATVSADVARRPTAARQIAGAAARRRARSGVAAAAVVALAYLTAASRPSVLVALVFGASVAATSVHGVLATAWRAFGPIGVEVGTEVGSRALVLGVGVAVLAAGGGLLGAVAVYAAADVATLLLFAWRTSALPDDGSPPAPPDGSRSGLWWLAVAVPLANVYWRLDVWLLGVLGSASDLAHYGAAYKLLDASLLPALALASLVAPRVAATAPDLVVPLIRRAALLAVVSVLPIVVVGLVAPDRVLGALYGTSYRSGGELLTVLAMAAVPSAAVLVLTATVMVVDRRRYARAVFIALGLNVGVNLVAIPQWGARGAAWTTLASQLVLITLLWRSIASSPDRSRWGTVR